MNIRAITTIQLTSGDKKDILWYIILNGKLQSSALLQPMVQPMVVIMLSFDIDSEHTRNCSLYVKARNVTIDVVDGNTVVGN